MSIDQIEELAWVLCDIPKHPSIKSCEQCGNKHCHAIYYAERAINADYRKRSQGAWIKSYRSGVTVSKGYVSSCCDMWNDRKSPFCPNCGSRMSGGNNDGYNNK